ncbi:cellulose-binding protein [Tessaracoccus lubricantis]|uniref:Cellulose-binding protein n=1 Tax=Tessaracoccus lubricantis TaxID=545543 RepID=A0ABP9FLQ7_9ACTN
MSSNFRTVLRGYEPAQVDAEIATLQQALDSARAELGEFAVKAKEAAAEREQLAAELAAAKSRAEEQSRATTMVSRPAFTDLGERVGQILTLAEEEAEDMKRKAKEKADQLVADAQKKAQAALTEADRYAVDTRSAADADAEAKLTGAQRRADEIIDNADREAAARREEAEAVYESQQARAAQAAADFERTLAERRDAATADFNLAMGQRQEQLEAAEENLRGAENDALRVISDANSQAEAIRTKAQAEADELIGEARTQAERIRRDSDRELAALTQRRDSITAQLSNVRQMLATLGGGAALAAVDNQEAAMSQNQQEPVDRSQGDEDRVHAQEAAEGAKREGETHPDNREHAQDPAEGAEDAQ